MGIASDNWLRGGKMVPVSEQGLSNNIFALAVREICPQSTLLWDLDHARFTDPLNIPPSVPLKQEASTVPSHADA